MAASASTRILEALHRGGMTDQQIGKALGRNSSLIRQVRLGKKPGRNLENALRQLQSRRQITPPPRRTTRAGEQARVRAGRRVTPSGRFIHTYYQHNAKSFLRKIQTLAKRHRYVELHVLFGRIKHYKDKVEHRMETVILYAKGGRDAAKILREMERYFRDRKGNIDAWGWLEYAAMQRPDVDFADEVVAVTIYEL